MKLPKVEFRKTDDVLEVYSQDASRWYRVKPLGVFSRKIWKKLKSVLNFATKTEFL
jgi:glycolate oxidase/D-lactate dehydrogenase